MNKKIRFPWSDELDKENREKVEQIILNEESKEEKDEYLKDENNNCCAEIMQIINECVQTRLDNRTNIDKVIEDLKKLME